MFTFFVVFWGSASLFMGVGLLAAIALRIASGTPQDYEPVDTAREAGATKQREASQERDKVDLEMAIHQSDEDTIKPLRRNSREYT